METKSFIGLHLQKLNFLVVGKFIDGHIYHLENADQIHYF